MKNIKLKAVKLKTVKKSVQDILIPVSFIKDDDFLPAFR